MGNGRGLSGTTGSVLDPVFALRTTLRVPAGQSVVVIVSTFFADTRDEAVRTGAALSSFDQAARSFDIASEATAQQLASLGTSPLDARAYQEMAGELLFSTPATGVGGYEPTRADLLATGPSGEWPIVLAHIDEANGVAEAHALLAMHRFWRAKSIGADLVILCESAEIRDSVHSVIDGAPEKNLLGHSPGIFVRVRDSLAASGIQALESTARVRFASEGGRLVRRTHG